MKAKVYYDSRLALHKQSVKKKKIFFFLATDRRLEWILVLEKRREWNKILAAVVNYKSLFLLLFA